MLLYHFSFFGFRLPIAAPIATPTVIHTGSLVAAKNCCAYCRTNTNPVSNITRVLIFLLILCGQLYLLHCDRVFYNSK